MRWTRTGAALIAVTAATTLLGSCTGSGGSGSVVNGAAGGAPIIGGSTRGSAYGPTAPAASEPAQSSAGGGTAGSGKDASGTATDLELGGSKIRTVSLTVALAHAADVAPAADKAEAIAAGYGGDVDGDDRAAGPHAHATVILKIPPVDLRRALKDLSALGRERSRSSSTQDVTQQVADVNSRVTSLTTEIATLQELYNRSGQPLSAVLEVEQTLAQRQSDLESLEAQQRALQRETSMATVTLDLVTATATTPVHRHRPTSGFVAGLRKGWDAFVSGATHVATALGAALPFALLVVLLAGGLRLAGVRRPRRRVQPTE